MPSSSKPDAGEPILDPRDEARAACRRQALDLLTRREHSRLEPERKLVSRTFDPELIVTTLDGLEAEGLLVEARFVEAFVRERARKGQGPVRIRAELLQRGIGEHQASAQLASPELDWSVLAREVRAKRFGTMSPESFEERAKQMRFLRYRGFEAAQIHAALDLAADSD